MKQKLNEKMFVLHLQKARALSDQTNLINWKLSF